MICWSIRSWMACLKIWHPSIVWPSPWWYLQWALRLYLLGTGCGIGMGPNGFSNPLTCSFSKATFKVMCVSEKFLQHLQLPVDGLTAPLLMWQGTTLGIGSIDMFLLIGKDSWKDNLMKSLTLFFKNWKSGISQVLVNYSCTRSKA